MLVDGKVFFLAAYEQDAGPKGIPTAMVGGGKEADTLIQFTIKELAARCDTKSLHDKRVQ